MSMMECGHCRQTADARSMHGCNGCGQMICTDCSTNQVECASDEEYDDR